MKTAASNRLFVDTNVLVYASVLPAPLHEVAVQALHRQQTVGTETWISRQILREWMATVTRPQSLAL